MGRESCIEHPSNSRFFVCRREYLAITDNNGCAAMLLHVFEYWTNTRLATQEERGGDLWIFRSHGELQRDDLLGVYGLDKVRDSLNLLIDLGVLERRRNPKHAWDHKPQWRLAVARVQTLINGLNSASGESETQVSGTPDLPLGNQRNNTKDSIKNSEKKTPTELLRSKGESLDFDESLSQSPTSDNENGNGTGEGEGKAEHVSNSAEPVANSANGNGAASKPSSLRADVPRDEGAREWLAVPDPAGATDEEHRAAWAAFRQLAVERFADDDPDAVVCATHKALLGSGDLSAVSLDAIEAQLEAHDRRVPDDGPTLLAALDAGGSR